MALRYPRVENLTKEEAEEAEEAERLHFDTETEKAAYVIWRTAAIASFDIPAIPENDEKFKRAREELDAYFQEWLEDG